MSFYDELKQRNVIRVGAAYVVVAWLLIQVAETIFPLFGFDETPARIVVIALAVGFIPSLVLAWAFELTPEGLKRDQDVKRIGPASEKAGQRLDRLIMVVLALALGYFAFDKFVLDPAEDEEIAETARQEARSAALVEPYGEQSIAVLAFEDLSPDGDQAYLADGLAEEILNLLAKIPELRVISRSSAFAFKDRPVPIPTIGEQLNVAHILEGSVRKAGDRIRVTAQLIDARSDTHLWSETYDRVLEDIFAIQDELAGAVVEQLHITLLGEVPMARKIDPEAYLLYLQGKEARERGESQESVRLLGMVVEMEPEFADAWAELSRAYVRLAPSLGSTDHSKDPIWPKMLEARERVGELDPDHPWMLTTLGWETIELEGDYVAAADYFKRAVEEHPHEFEPLMAGGFFASLVGLEDLAATLSQRALALNPLCAGCTYSVATGLVRVGRYEDAERILDRYRRMIGEGQGGELSTGTVRLVVGDLEGAEEIFAKRSDEIGRLYGRLLLRAARGERGPDIIEDIAEFAAQDSYLNPKAPLELYAMVEETDAAFEWLHRIADNQANWRLAGLLQSGLLVNLHDDPRWAEMLEKAGIARHQLEGLQFNPRLPFSTAKSP